MVKIIAEAGVNHNGERDLAFALVEQAAKAGADFVKFQTFSAKRLASVTATKAEYQKKTTDSQETQLEMLTRLELPESWHVELQQFARSQGVEFLSTAFDLHSLEFLHQFNMPFYKIPSGEITNAPLLWQFAATGTPLLLSTGMATLGEVEQALAVIAHAILHEQPPNSLQEVWENWCKPEVFPSIQDKVTLLHCTSRYPTPVEEVNLLAMDTLANAFRLPVGYSDHTEGILIPVAAVARGARVIEKHFTLDRNLPGPDHKASLEPDELRQMVEQIRNMENALGSSLKRPQPREWENREVTRQKLIALSDIALGETFSGANLGTARTAGGESAFKYWDVLGGKANKDYKAGEVI
jgi:N-acetylneuraminate synthase